MSMTSFVRLLSWTAQDDPLLGGREDENRRAWEALPMDAREKAEATARLNAEAARVHRRHRAGDITEEEAAALTREINEERTRIGRVDQEAWVVYRRMLGWSFLREVQEKEATPVPNWAYSAEGVNDAPAHVLGPYIAALRCSVLALFATHLSVFALTAVSPGFAGSAWRWLAPLPSLLVALFADWKVSRRFMVPYLYRLDDAQMNPFAVCGFVKVPLRHLWVWAANGIFSGMVAVVQNFTAALAAGLLLVSLRGGLAAGMFQYDSPGLRRLEAAFLACWAWKLSHFILPLVFTYRKGELTGSGFNGWGDHGMGWTLCNDQVYNDDVALSLAESAGASVLKSFAIKFAQAHVKTAKAPMLALKTANSQANRLLVSLITTKVPLGAHLVLQGLILKFGRGEAGLSMGEWVIMANTLAGVCLGLLDVASVRDFEAMVGELVAAVGAARRIGLWQLNNNGDAEARERAYGRIFVLRRLVRFSAVLVVLCSGVAVWCIATVLRAHGLLQL